jgi:3,4-dihydroxy 2-butanone 4-phosphate synthase/3,4-dihydroxy 2-butanone 4-phosphate synthase/GTP cyclohydrolase II
MFSGLITEVGTVGAVNGGVVIDAPKTAGALTIGGSVCVNGVCLSAVDVGDSWFRTDISSETGRRSTLAELVVGEPVNLELPLRVGDPLGGHLVQGHADAVGKVTLLEYDQAGGRRVWIRPPRRFMDDVIAKGSIAVNGVSLTVAEVVRDRFSVALRAPQLAGPRQRRQ